MRIKRILSAIICLIITVTAISVTCLDVSAAEPTYKMSARYKEGKYYKNFSAVTLTGDQASDVLAIALSQLGYLEGDSDDGLCGTVGGDRDFVEYNVLYGKIDNNQGNGLSYGYYWCASFVNWCLREANVSKEASATGEVSCRRWLSACKNADIYVEKSEIPQSGDIIFFKDADSEVSSTHMGLVRYSDGDRVYTVEGNTLGEDYSSDGDRVAIKSYPLTSSYIVGYARPKYEKTADARVDHTGKYLTKGLYISKEEIEIFDEALTVSKGKIGENEVFYVTDLKDNIAKISYQSGGEMYEGYADISNRTLQLNSTETACRISFFDSDGEALIAEKYVDASIECPVIDRVFAEDKGLAGWADAPDADNAAYSADGSVKVNEDKMLYAVWDHNRYEISFVGIDDQVIATESGYLGDTVTPPEVVLPDGYVFLGWGEDFSPIIDGNRTYHALYEGPSSENGEASSESGTAAILPANSLLGCKAGANSLAVIFFTLAGSLCVLKKRRKY